MQELFDEGWLARPAKGCSRRFLRMMREHEEPHFVACFLRGLTERFNAVLLDFGGVHFLQYILAGLVPLGSLINGFVA